jgi:hypothetical protein
MHGGASQNFLLAFLGILEKLISEKIGRDGSTVWHPSSPDLSPLDFYL